MDDLKVFKLDIGNDLKLHSIHAIAVDSVDSSENDLNTFINFIAAGH